MDNDIFYDDSEIDSRAAELRISDNDYKKIEHE